MMKYEEQPINGFDTEEYNLLIETIGKAKRVLQEMKDKPGRYDQAGITIIKDDIAFWEKELEIFDKRIKSSEII